MLPPLLRPQLRRDSLGGTRVDMPEPVVQMSHEGEPVSPRLRPLLLAVYNELKGRPTNLALLRRALDDLLVFLASSEGRTNANCWAADLFFTLGEGWDIEGWDVPDEYGDILGDMSGALHDTVQSPEIADNFESTPEQLLARLRAIPSSAA